MDKVLVFGIGGGYEKVKEIITEKYDIIAFVDNKKFGTSYEGKKIIAPNDITKNDFEYIFIASHSYYYDIKEQLLDMNIDEDKIISSIDIYEDKYYKEWINNDTRPMPFPNKIKQMAILEYIDKYEYSTFIETGTYRGQMIEFVQDKFKKIYSIELSEKLYLSAKKRFNKYDNIELIQGDSGKKIYELMNRIDCDCLFWLDAHYSAGITIRGDKFTPIIDELDCILHHSCKNHSILIDDANDFCGENDYPTVEELREFVNGINSDYRVFSKDNIIFITK